MIKKLIYIDTFCDDGHVNFNKIYIDGLKKENYSIIFILKKGYGEKLMLSEEHTLIELPNFLYKTYKIGFLNRIINYTLINYLFLIIFLKLDKEAVKLITAYDELVLSFCPWFPASNLVNHNNIDNIKNKFKKIFFINLQKKHSHIVFNNYINNYLKNLGVINSVVVPHGLPPKLEHYKKESKFKKYILLPFSNSIDSNFIKKLLDNAAFIEFLKQKDINIVIKGITGKNTLNVFYINKYLKKIEYNSLLMSSYCVLLPYSEGFNYRVSGILHECIANNKPVLVRKTKSFLVYKSFFSYDAYFSNNVDLLAVLEKLSLKERGNYFKELTSLEVNFTHKLIR